MRWSNHNPLRERADCLSSASHAFLTGWRGLGARIWSLSKIGRSEPSKAILSEREKQLLRLITLGRRNKEIAAELKLSPNSIETYRARLMKKVGYRNTAELVRYAIREGIAPL